MEPPSAAELVRTTSQTSNSNSASSRKSATARAKASKRSSTASLRRNHSPTADDKSLTSFPSLSPTPDSSPVQSRVNGWLRSAVGDFSNKVASRENGGSSPDTVKASSVVNSRASSAVRKVTKSTQDIVGSLVAASPSTKSRTALFDDTPQESSKVLGNLHVTTDENVEHMLERVGPTRLVKQLAGDLAQRDTQITALRRRAEERERILRKMLQECEVSNMDIENRLRELDRHPDQENERVERKRRSKKRVSDIGLDGTHPDDGIDKRLALAVDDELPHATDATSFDNTSLQENRVADPDRASLASVPESQEEPKRSNWKNYLWSGTTKRSRTPSIAERDEPQTRSRASSAAFAPRKALNSDTFLPPAARADEGSGAIPSLRRLQSEDRGHSTSSSRRSSGTFSNWALKMVAGNIQGGRNPDKQNTVRGRKPVSISDVADRTSSQHSAHTTRSGPPGTGSTVRGRGPRAAYGPNGTIKSVSPESLRTAITNVGPLSPTVPTRNLSNLGPVEMDTILPEEGRPPTLLQHHNRFATSTEYLTDRFGFIYDQRRKKRQSEAAAAITKQKRSSNVESLGDGRSVLSAFDREDDTTPAESQNSKRLSRPGSSDDSPEDQQLTKTTKTWQDYLKLATHPTELLSHTPAAAPVTVVESPEAELQSKISQVVIAKRGSLPSSSVNPEPSPSRIVSSNAEFATASPSVFGPSSPIHPQPPQGDPVKSLLEQLTDLHDSLQKEKTPKWNEFLRKVRAERKREGEAATTTKNLITPEALVADGELVGISGLGNKGKVGRAKWQEFRKLVLGGIPVSYRPKVWAECSGASHLRIPGYYEDLVNNGVDNPTIVAQIQMDITRTLTDNIFFRKGPGVHKLNEVLLAYSRRNPEVGYCQGMNLITACLLLIMPTAEDAFWMLATMIENILPQKYYDQHLLTSRADQAVLRSYVEELLPTLSAHLNALDIELEALTFQWFLSVFTDCLSAEALYRVWDVVLCMHDGSTFLFQVALALLKLNEKALRECDSPAAVYHYINHQMTNHAISIDSLIQASDALNKVVKRKDVEERREKAVAHEEELMRQREVLRQERAMKRASRQSQSQVLEEERGAEADEYGKLQAGSGPVDSAISVSPAQNSSLIRTPVSLASSTRDEEDEELLSQESMLEELQMRTPMPIEEESLWRG